VAVSLYYIYSVAVSLYYIYSVAVSLYYIYSVAVSLYCIYSVAVKFVGGRIPDIKCHIDTISSSVSKNNISFTETKVYFELYCPK
jgi:hypothetical protein